MSIILLMLFCFLKYSVLYELCYNNDQEVFLMKKVINLLLCLFSLILTFMISNILSIYHFESNPTALTMAYLIIIYFMITYLSLSVSYIVNRLIKREKIGYKKILGLISMFIGLLLVCLLIVIINFDYIKWYAYSSPFYLNVIIRCLEFLIPSLIFIIIGVVLLKRKLNNRNIRAFCKKDLERVVDIWYNSSIDTYNFISKDHWDSMKDKVRSKFLESKIYVYEEDSIIKGFILIEDGYIDELYVDKKYRSNGIGKQLLNYVKSDYEELTLNIFQKNVDGIRFYQNNGFIVVEENTEDSTNEKGYFMKWHK